MTVGTRTTIAGHPAVLSSVPVGGRALALHTVPELERLVDRGALLRGEAEPPYWAYLWAGATTLAAYVDRWVETRGRRVLEVGQLQQLSDEVGPARTLLVLCTAFRGRADRYPNLTVKKIPKHVLARCEWGHDDYSLRVENLPKAPPKPGQQALFAEDAGS